MKIPTFLMQASRRRLLRLALLLLLLPLFFLIADSVFFLVWNFSHVGQSDSRQAFDALIDAVSRGPSPPLPRRVHQIWMGSRPPPARYTTCAQSWRALTNKGYSYTLWNATTLHDFISKNFSAFLPVWRGYTYDMNRIDTAKYFLLFYFGGIYADMDVCNTVDDPVRLIASEKYFGSSPPRDVLLIRGLPSGVNPEYMVAPPRNPFFAHALRNLHYSNRYFLIPYLYMMCVGGPCFLTGVYGRYSARERIVLLKYHEARGKLFGAVRGGEWYTWDSHFLISVLYFGVLQGQLVPSWFVMLVCGVLLALLVVFVWRRVRIKGWFRALCARVRLRK